MDPAQLAKIPAGVPAMAMDHMGNPFIILRDEGRMKRSTGNEAIYENIASCLKLTDSIKSSFGPKGADKIIVSPDGEVTVTNDGATIMDKMNIVHQATKLLVELSKSQDEQIGDGTTGVVILAGALLQEAEILLRRGLHPLKIIDGYEEAAAKSVEFLDAMATAINIDGTTPEELLAVTKTTLGSKLIKERKDMFAQICVDAVTSVADSKTKDVNFDMIKLNSITGGRLEDSELIRGVVLEKALCSTNQQKCFKNVKIAVLTCPFEPPKPKTKHRVEINSADQFKDLLDIEQQMFKDQIEYLKKAGVELVICQWGFDYEAAYLLHQANIPSIRWVGGQEIEHIAMVCNARIIPRFEEITPEKLGFATKVEEVSYGTAGDRMVIIEGSQAKVPACTILIRGGNKVSIEEAERSIHDALCTVRNMIDDPKVLPGGGASETQCALKLEDIVYEGVEQYAVKSFASALMSVSATLATNSGLDCLAVTAEIRSKQVEENNYRYGVDCNGGGVVDMISIGIYESLTSKKSQIMLATQVVKMILRISDVMSTQEQY